MSKIGLISNVINFITTMLACDSSDAENEQKSLCLKRKFFFFTSGWIRGCLSCKSALPYSHTVKLSSNNYPRPVIFLPTFPNPISLLSSSVILLFFTLRSCVICLLCICASAWSFRASIFISTITSDWTPGSAVLIPIIAEHLFFYVGKSESSF